MVKQTPFAYVQDCGQDRIGVALVGMMVSYFRALPRSVMLCLQSMVQLTLSAYGQNPYLDHNEVVGEEDSLGSFASCHSSCLISSPPHSVSGLASLCTLVAG